MKRIGFILSFFVFLNTTELPLIFHKLDASVVQKALQDVDTLNRMYVGITEWNINSEQPYATQWRKLPQFYYRGVGIYFTKKTFEKGQITFSQGPTLIVPKSYIQAVMKDFLKEVLKEEVLSLSSRWRDCPSPPKKSSTEKMAELSLQYSEQVRTMTQEHRICILLPNNLPPSLRLLNFYESKILQPALEILKRFPAQKVYNPKSTLYELTTEINEQQLNEILLSLNSKTGSDR